MNTGIRFSFVHVKTLNVRYNQRLCSTINNYHQWRGVPASKSHQNNLYITGNPEKHVKLNRTPVGKWKWWECSIVNSLSIKEAHLSHTFAWWGSPRPGNRWSSSAQCWPYAEGTGRDGITEEWRSQENTAWVQERAQEGKTLRKCSSGKREETIMGENCFFILKKSVIKNTKSSYNSQEEC